MTKTLYQTIGDNHRIDETIGEKTTDTKIMAPQVIAEIEVQIK